MIRRCRKRAQCTPDGACVPHSHDRNLSQSPAFAKEIPPSWVERAFHEKMQSMETFSIQLLKHEFMI
jgi:hypothetical protein